MCINDMENYPNLDDVVWVDFLVVYQKPGEESLIVCIVRSYLKT